MNDVIDRLASVRGAIAEAASDAGRPADAVTLIAVSKKHPATAVRRLAEAGQRDFGENYVDEAIAKMDELADLELTWHFIGQLQSNKTRAVAEHFAWVHSVDRLKIARRLSEQRPAHLPPLAICLEVNVSGEASKGGVTPKETRALAEAVAALPRLSLRGLMALPAPEDDPVKQRAAFAEVAALARSLADIAPVDVLSMGTTADYPAAIAEGATHVRVGTAVFGQRPG